MPGELLDIASCALGLGPNWSAMVIAYACQHAVCRSKVHCLDEIVGATIASLVIHLC